MRRAAADEVHQASLKLYRPFLRPRVLFPSPHVLFPPGVPISPRCAYFPQVRLFPPGACYFPVGSSGGGRLRDFCARSASSSINRRCTYRKRMFSYSNGEPVE